MRLRRLVWLIPFVIMSAGAWAHEPQAGPADPPVPSMRVLRTDDFTIDGKGASPAWSKAEWQLLVPRAAGKDPHPTRVKMLYSPTGLYVLMDGEDSVLTATMREDFLDLWTEDVFEFFLWPDQAHPVYFEYRDLAARVRAADPRAELRRPVLWLAPVALRGPAEDPEGGDRPGRPRGERRANHGLDGGGVPAVRPAEAAAERAAAERHHLARQCLPHGLRRRPHRQLELGAGPRHVPST